MPDLSFFGNRERRLRARAHGRVLDLGGRQGDRRSLEDLVTDGETFDSVLSIFRLSLSHHPLRDARAIERLLVDDGELFLLEPTASVGVAGLFERVVGRPNHDIPAILREAGLSMSECDRIVVNTALPARTYVEGVAFRTLLPARGAAG